MRIPSFLRHPTSMFACAALLLGAPVSSSTALLLDEEEDDCHEFSECFCLATEDVDPDEGYIVTWNGANLGNNGCCEEQGQETRCVEADDCSWAAEGSVFTVFKEGAHSGQWWYIDTPGGTSNATGFAGETAEIVFNPLSKACTEKREYHVYFVDAQLQHIGTAVVTFECKDCGV